MSLYVLFTEKGIRDSEIKVPVPLEELRTSKEAERKADKCPQCSVISSPPEMGPRCCRNTGEEEQSSHWDSWRASRRR